MTDPVFDSAYAYAAPHEGGYQCDPNDAGNWAGGKVGAGELKGTNGGVSAASYPNLDIKNLTSDEIKSIYWRDWWLKQGFDKIASPTVAAKLFDAGINLGMAEAVICLQRALRAYGKSIQEDGVLGPLTFAAVNSIPYSFLPAFRSEIAGHYRLIVAKKPGDAEFLSGWLTRAYG